MAERTDGAGIAGTLDKPQITQMNADGNRPVVSNQWSVISGPWSVVRGPWSVVRGPWSVVRASRPSAAFTLIELLVVIAIIGLLAALLMNLLPRAADMKVRSRVKTE